MRRKIRRPQTALRQASAGLIEPDVELARPTVGGPFQAADSFIGRRIACPAAANLPLLDDPIEAAYPVGLIEEPYAHFATWVGWPVQGAETIIVFYEVAGPTVAFCMGRPAGIQAILETATELPPTLYAVCQHVQLPELERWYTFDKVTEKLRMALTARTDIRAGRGGSRTAPTVERLGPGDLREIVELLSPEDMRVDLAQLHQGRYFGVRLPAGGELVSVAAAHLVSYQRRMALTGNFVTRSDQRGRGFATAAILRLLDELRPVIHSICLDVDADSPAVKLYETLGFAPRSRHLEALGRRNN